MLSDESIINGILEGLSHAEIGRQAGVSRPMIHKRLKRYYQERKASSRFEFVRSSLIKPHFKSERILTSRKLKAMRLSAVELTIIKGVVEGLSDEEIAKPFGFSHWVIKKRMTRIFDKTGMDSRVELVLLVCAKVFR